MGVRQQSYSTDGGDGVVETVNGDKIVQVAYAYYALVRMLVLSYSQEDRYNLPQSWLIAPRVLQYSS